jgi:septal ring factor EnvC (AmiA/AmiB activator)
VAAKKRTAPADKDLKKTVKKLRTQLDRADTKAGKWKKKSDQLQKSLTQSEAKVKKLSKRLDKATRTAETSPADDTTSPTVAPIPAVAQPVTEPVTEVAEVSDTSQDAAGPDESWTVVQLRAEARSRGLTGLSGKSKAQLLDALG